MSFKAFAAGAVGYLATSYVGNAIVDKLEGVSSEKLADDILHHRPVGNKLAPHVMMIPISIYAGISAYQWAKKKK